MFDVIPVRLLSGIDAAVLFWKPADLVLSAGETEPRSRRHELSAPVSPPRSSMIFSVQVPLGFSPLKAESDSSGVSEAAGVRFT